MKLRRKYAWGRLKYFIEIYSAGRWEMFFEYNNPVIYYNTAEDCDRAIAEIQRKLNEAAEIQLR